MSLHPLTAKLPYENSQPGQDALEARRSEEGV
jgi:hypothetical protein